MGATRDRPKWWDVLWLNEAFATLQGEVIIPDRIFPEFKVRREFLTTHLMAALSLDAVRSSHPIEVPCPDANQINQIFDSISYSKGASVLRMLAAVVGEDKFLKGVSIYLKKHLYGNASTKDLWAGISEASGVDVTRIMNEWILNVGFPVISVEEVDGGKSIKVTQDRFLNTGDVKPEENETLWYVPLELKTDVQGNVSVDHEAILSERSKTIDLKGASAFKLNAETVGVCESRRVGGGNRSRRGTRLTHISFSTPRHRPCRLFARTSDQARRRGRQVRLDLFGRGQDRSRLGRHHTRSSRFGQDLGFAQPRLQARRRDRVRRLGRHRHGSRQAQGGLVGTTRRGPQGHRQV